jgi:hypothetical protein
VEDLHRADQGHEALKDDGDQGRLVLSQSA